MSSVRPFLWSILVIGIAMIVMPFVISLPGKASHGQTMISQFQPIMKSASVAKSVAYYNDTFVPLRSVAVGGVQAGKEIPGLIQGLSSALHMTPAETESFLGTRYPAMAGLLTALPKLEPVFGAVPGGLAWYKPLVDTMRANVNNYAQISSLPNFRLFTWFFVIPGALISLLALGGLLFGRRGREG